VNRPSIALFGSTSHIAKGLIYNFLREGAAEIHLFTTSPDKAEDFLAEIGATIGKGSYIHIDYDDVMKGTFDVVINCVGPGTLNKMQGDYSRYFTIGEKYDNLAISYLQYKCPESLYISFSSGAIYGRGHSAPADENSVNFIPVNNVAPQDYYGITRLYTEAKHRSLTNLNIVDLRVFSYFSRFIDLNDDYFITAVINSVISKMRLKTDDVNIVRDYLHPADLFEAVEKCIVTKKINSAIDINSSKSIDKKTILEYFSSEYGLQYDITQSVDIVSATGTKDVYCSNNKESSIIGYNPRFSSMDTIIQETRFIHSVLATKDKEMDCETPNLPRSDNYA
jgi:hypothetical protein